MSWSSEPTAVPGARPAITVQDGVLGYGRRPPCLEIEHLTIEKGSLVLLTGENGSGKTTLLNALAGTLRPRSGRFSVLGSDPLVHRSSSQVAYLPAAVLVDEQVTARWQLTNRARSMGMTPNAAARSAAHLLELVGLADDADRRPRAFSTGMKRRLQMAATLVGGPRCLLLDEPLTPLDPQGRRRMRSLFRALAAGERTVVCASHEPHRLRPLMDLEARVEAGEVSVTRVPHGRRGLEPTDPMEVRRGRPQRLVRFREA